MRVEPVDPRLDNEWETDPTVNYRVVRWLERFIQECEPTLGEVGPAVAALAG